MKRRPHTLRRRYGRATKRSPERGTAEWYEAQRRKGARIRSGAELTWGDVRSVPASDLRPGDRFINPPMGVGYSTNADGTVRGTGWQPLEGTMWTVVAVSDGKLRAINQHGHETWGKIPPGRTVLRIEPR